MCQHGISWQPPTPSVGEETLKLLPTRPPLFFIPLLPYPQLGVAHRSSFSHFSAATHFPFLLLEDQERITLYLSVPLSPVVLPVWPQPSSRTVT